MNNSSRLFALVLSLSLRSAPDLRAGEPQLKEIVLRDYPPALKLLESRFASAKGVVRLTSGTESNAGKRVTFGTTSFQRRGPEFARVECDREMAITKTDNTKSWQLGMVMCRNRNYSFQLRRDGDIGPFSVSGIEGYSGGKTAADDHSMTSLLEVYLDAPYTLTGHRLSSLLSEEGFSVRGVSQVGENKPWLKVEFERKADSTRPKTPQGAELQGWFVVSPEEAWVLRSFDIDRGSGTWHLWGSIEYAGAQGGVPLPKRVVQHSRVKTGRARSSTWDFDEINLVDIPERNFTLSAFGFPEPGQAAARSAGGPALLLFCLACAGMALAVVLKLVASRLQRTATPVA